MVRLSKRIFYLSMVLLGLFSFGSLGCCSDVPIDGGLVDLSNHRAPKVIQSNTITEFSLQFKEERSIGRESIFDGKSTIASYPAGNYLLEAKRKGDTAHFYLMCDRNGAVNPLIFKKEVPMEALDELQAIIKKYNLAAINGSSLWNSALGTMLKLVVCYDSDEQLSVYAEGGVSTLPNGWCGTEVFLDFFVDKLQAGNFLVSPLYSCIYAYSNEDLVYTLELKSESTPDSKQAVLLKVLSNSATGERVTKEISVPREKLEEIEHIVAGYQMHEWKNLPSREDGEIAEVISIVLNYSDGNNICLDSVQKLPPEYKEAFEAVRKALVDEEDL